MEIIFTHDCDKCNTEMEHTILLVSDNKFPINFLEQTTLTCPDCGLEHFIGDINILNENDF